MREGVHVEHCLNPPREDSCVSLTKSNPNKNPNPKCKRYIDLLSAEWVPPILGGGGDLRRVWASSENELSRAVESVFADPSFLSTQQAPTVFANSSQKGIPTMSRIVGRAVTSPEIKLSYLVACGYFVSELILLVIHERQKPDFREMLLHHVVTCCLALSSLLAGMVRIGTLVLLIHGVTDILIYFSKMTVDSRHTMVVFAAYVALVVSFAWFRLYCYAMVVMRTVWMHSEEFLEPTVLLIQTLTLFRV